MILIPVMIFLILGLAFGGMGGLRGFGLFGGCHRHHHMPHGHRHMPHGHRHMPHGHRHMRHHGRHGHRNHHGRVR